MLNLSIAVSKDNWSTNLLVDKWMHFSELYTLNLYTQTYRPGEKTQDK